MILKKGKRYTRCSSLGVWPLGPDLIVIVRNDTEEINGTTRQQIFLLRCPVSSDIGGRGKVTYY
jgi:hypothetical protein